MSLGSAFSGAFKKVLNALKVAEEKIGEVLGLLESDAPQIEQVAEEVTPILQAIAAEAGNKTVTELAALATKFNQHMPSDPTNADQVNQLLQNAVAAEARKVLPTLSPTLLALGIAAAFHAFQAAATTNAIPAATPAPPAA